MKKDNLEQFDKLSKHSEDSECFSSEKEFNISITNNPALEGFRVFLNSNGNAPLLTKNEEYELGMRIKNGDKTARDKLIISNIRLVVSIAHKYIGLGLDYDDLIEEGMLGLINAVDKFEPEMNLRFSTYATYWIKQTMRRGIINKSRTVRIPAHAFETMLAMKKYMDDYYKKYGEEPDIETVAKGLNITVKRLEELKKRTGVTTSLDSLIGSDNDSVLSDFLADKKFDVEKELLFKELSESLKFGLDSLTEKERSVVLNRFGFLGHVTTQAEIGRRFGVSRECIRRHEYAALTKLKKPKLSRLYKNHMYDDYSGDYYAKSKIIKEKEKFQDLIELMNNFGIKFTNEEIKILAMLKGLDEKRVSVNSIIKDGYEKEYIIQVLNKFTYGLKEIGNNKAKTR